MTLGVNARIGLLAGLLLGIAGIAGGVGGFVVALLLGAAGLLTGRWLDGDWDIAELAERSGLTGRGSDQRR
jgi:nitrate/nitrite transporter NarK